MAKPPRPPREIKRSTDVLDASFASAPLLRRRDPRQAELFTTSFVEPCKPTLRSRAPVGPRWQYEIKHDGYRLQAHVSGGQVRLFTKGGFDWAARMPAIAQALQARSTSVGAEVRDLCRVRESRPAEGDLTPDHRPAFVPAGPANDPPPVILQRL
jgi:bifunctional non-homologous end joining protein LigD